SYLYPLMNHGYIDSIDSVIDKRAKIYYPLIETKKYINLFYSQEKNNSSQEIKKIVVNSTRFPDQIYILSVLEPILKYYSTEGYITKIKGSKGEEITLEGLVDQYFSNPEDYFELKNIENIESVQGEQQEQPQQQKEESEQSTEQQEIEPENETPEEKYNREQDEQKKWGDGLE
ncbi:MAG TPA: hypothetical protein VLA74_03475, partial [Nitrososphaeraceae archaeon]|nr:hypothetical protein [Nitrososphaeraceae archaeon]